MQVKTVLNRVHKIKGFVYGKIRLTDDRIEVHVRPRKGSRPICSGCGQPGPGYDALQKRHFQFVPLWAIGAVLVYAMRRADRLPKTRTKRQSLVNSHRQMCGLAMS